MSDYDRWKTPDPLEGEDDKDETYAQLDLMREQDAQAKNLPKS
jgi:hypothetical protein